MSLSDASTGDTAPETPAVEAPQPQSVSEAISSNPQPKIVTEAPAPETPETPETESLETEPVTEVPETEAPETVTELPETDDPYKDLGGREAVEAAIKLHERTQSEEGIVQLFLEAGLNMGLSYDDIEALFQSKSGSEDPDAGDGEDEDRAMTRKEFQAWQQEQAQAAQRAELERQQREAASGAQKVIHAELKDLGLDPDDEGTQAILAAGNKYFEKGNLDPEHLKSAVRRGHADFEALVERQYKEYLGKKKKAAEDIPSAPAGNAAPSESAPPEPRNIDEAIKRTRAKLRGG